MSYKVTNKLGNPVKFGDTIFQPHETKVLEEKPTSDKFIVEMTEEKEEPKKMKKVERRDK